MPWYRGQPLLELLDTIEIAQAQDFQGVRFPVQYVNRPNLDFRGFSGTLAAGVLKKGDPVMALPSRKTSKVKAIVTYDGELDEAFAPQAVTVTLEDEIDISRGDWLVLPEDKPMVGNRCEAHIVWMNEAPLAPGKQYYFKLATRTVTGAVPAIRHRIDVNTLEHSQTGQLKLNEIGLCELAFNAPVAFDPYRLCKTTGAFIVIDRLSNATVGAGMIVGLAEQSAESRRVSPAERAARLGQRPLTVWLVGENRLEFAYKLERGLFDSGHLAMVLERGDGQADVATLARCLSRAGLVCLCPVDGGPLAGEGGQMVLSTEGLDIHAAIESLGLSATGLDGEPEFAI
jgi:bifunctional enzyme CysN/CysC